MCKRGVVDVCLHLVLDVVAVVMLVYPVILPPDARVSSHLDLLPVIPLVCICTG